MGEILTACRARQLYHAAAAERQPRNRVGGERVHDAAALRLSLMVNNNLAGWETDHFNIGQVLNAPAAKEP
jgi:hypothetical protein